jgi:Kef-type K+ transport system membrane component KefB
MLIASIAADVRFGRVLLALVVIVAVARIAGAVARRLRQPAVIGEVVAGIALGPSLLGRLAPGLTGQLFPTDVRPHLQVVASIGLVLFMFVVGLELDARAVRASGRRAATIALASIALPFALGAGVLAPVLFRGHRVVAGRAVEYRAFALFVGVALCGTAFAVLARVLADHGLLHTRLGSLLLSCAAIDDVITFALLGVVTAMATARSPLGVLVTVGALVLFVGVLIAVKPLVGRLLQRTGPATAPLQREHVGILIAATFAAALVTSRIGLHPMMGAFLFGAAIPAGHRHRVARDVRAAVETVSVQVLMPVFFVVTGLAVDASRLGRNELGPTVLVLVLACAGKLIGSASAARATGMSTRDALVVGTMMNTRGLTELVVLEAGRAAGIIDPTVFTMLVVMAVVTTVMAGPFLTVLLPARRRAVSTHQARDERRTAGVPASSHSA